MSRKAYVVSEDLKTLLDRWSLRQYGRILDLPYVDIRHRLKEILAFDDHDVVQVSEQEMRDSMLALLENETRPVVSVDPVYWPAKDMIHVTRAVHAHDLSNAVDLFNRYGHASVDDQIRSVASSLGANGTGACVDAVLADDVVYSGDVMARLIGMLHGQGVDIVRVVCGIAVVEANSDPFALCRSLGAVLHAGRSFGIPGTQEAVDEICERDFFVFSPMCGRTLAYAEENVGVPYLFPFGKADKWASFGDHAERVSRQLIRLNVDVLRMIEDELGEHVTFQDLERKPFRVRHQNVQGDRVLLHLETHLS